MNEDSRIILLLFKRDEQALQLIREQYGALRDREELTALMLDEPVAVRQFDPSGLTRTGESPPGRS